jgi:hypothetical protein
VLTRLGADHARVRDRVLSVLTGECGPADSQTRLVADLFDAAKQLTRVRRQKEAAFDAGDLDGAGALRDRERQLLADKVRLEQQLTAATCSASTASSQTTAPPEPPDLVLRSPWRAAGGRRSPALRRPRRRSRADALRRGGGRELDADAVPDMVEDRRWPPGRPSRDRRPRPGRLAAAGAGDP